MRTTLALTIISILVLALQGAALANNPPGDPLPVAGEPECFGARVSHSASDHRLTPAAKVAAVEGFLELLQLPGVDPVWEDAYVAYWDANGVSVQSVQQWIRINCSDTPIIAN